MSLPAAHLIGWLCFLNRSTVISNITYEQTDIKQDTKPAAGDD
jgi:hypothetical protein